METCQTKFSYVIANLVNFHALVRHCFSQEDSFEKSEINDDRAGDEQRLMSDLGRALEESER